MTPNLARLLQKEGAEFDDYHLIKRILRTDAAVEKAVADAGGFRRLKQHLKLSKPRKPKHPVC